MTDDPQIRLGGYGYWRTDDGWRDGEAATDFGDGAWWLGGRVVDEALIAALDHIEELETALAVSCDDARHEYGGCPLAPRKDGAS